ncbi:hypothetical protein [Cardinium endosymbiont of Culicoides punctatus]|uniref:hypothetical protein n=1 Tax=Cardinium endosymbiont of Culicoides punctatus TaxID=2304601 RepID=UPI001058D7F2|nr:hypothetical protein [Cardinium endosymbiont of Culicoides punctatus]TDG95190.1 hypothetical protein CCPUN_06110 [Cardinium endosymbiont of Culicoides punctatus]
MKKIFAGILFINTFLSGCNKTTCLQNNMQSQATFELSKMNDTSICSLGGHKNGSITAFELDHGKKIAIYPDTDNPGQWKATITDFRDKFSHEKTYMVIWEKGISLSSIRDGSWLSRNHMVIDDAHIYIGSCGLRGGGYWWPYACDKCLCFNKWWICEQCGLACDEGESGLAWAWTIGSHFVTLGANTLYISGVELYKLLGHKCSRDNYETTLTRRFCLSHCGTDKNGCVRSKMCRLHWSSCPRCNQCSICEAYCRTCCGCMKRQMEKIRSRINVDRSIIRPINQLVNNEKRENDMMEIAQQVNAEACKAEQECKKNEAIKRTAEVLNNTYYAVPKCTNIDTNTSTDSETNISTENETEISTKDGLSAQALFTITANTDGGREVLAELLEKGMSLNEAVPSIIPHIPVNVVEDINDISKIKK